MKIPRKRYEKKKQVELQKRKKIRAKMKILLDGLPAMMEA